MFNDKVALTLALVLLGVGLFWLIFKHVEAYRIKLKTEERVNEYLKSKGYKFKRIIKRG